MRTGLEVSREGETTGNDVSAKVPSRPSRVAFPYPRGFSVSRRTKNHLSPRIILSSRFARSNGHCSRLIAVNWRANEIICAPYSAIEVQRFVLFSDRKFLLTEFFGLDRYSSVESINGFFQRIPSFRSRCRFSKSFFFPHFFPPFRRLPFIIRESSVKQMDEVEMQAKISGGLTRAI